MNILHICVFLLVSSYLVVSFPIIPKFVRWQRHCNYKESFKRILAKTNIPSSQNSLATQVHGNKLLFKVAILLDPTASGQMYGERAELHAINACRPITDIQMWTHIFFIISAILAANFRFYDMLVLLCVSTPLLKVVPPKFCLYMASFSCLWLQLSIWLYLKRCQ